MAKKQVDAIKNINEEVSAIKESFTKLTEENDLIKNRLSEVESALAAVQKNSSQLTTDEVNKISAIPTESEKSINELKRKLEKHKENLVRNNVIIKGLPVSEENITEQIPNFWVGKLNF